MEDYIRRRTVFIDRATAEQIARTREHLSHGSIVPSESAIVREALARGLNSLERNALKSKARVVSG
jgi:hypothetical protein